MTEHRKKSASRASRRKRLVPGERRLVLLAVAIIAVAAASIGAMLALQYRTADLDTVQESPVAAAAEPTEQAAQALPVYEEVPEPTAVPPLRAATPPPRLDAPLPGWRKNAVRPAVPVGDTRPKIVVVIDDLGVDRERSARTVALPGPLTMAFLPYANDLAAQTGAARRAGHELLVHVPMDPRNREITDPGPNALLVDLDAAELKRRLDWSLSQFGGYVGINNHMGSRFTADAAVLKPVMHELRRRGLVFLDSRTSTQSAATAVAHEAGVPVVVRDVFIDHERTPEAVHAALAAVEAVARRNGHAIAIGHPRDITIDALAVWLPQLEANGFQLVPLTAIVGELYPAGVPD